MADVLSDDLLSPNVKRRKVVVEKGLLDLPVNLMHEVFGPLDARSLLETAKSHDTLRKNVMDWPDKRWEIVHLSSDVAIIDYETFNRREAEILLKNTQHKKEIFELPYDLIREIMRPLVTFEQMSLAKCHPNLLLATRNLPGKQFERAKFLPRKVIITSVGYNRKCDWTHGEVEVLLNGAFVHRVEYTVETNIALDICVNSLTFRGRQKHAHKCAGLIEEWKPSEVIFPKWNAEAFRSNPELARVLKDVKRLEVGFLAVECLSYVPEWKFKRLSFQLNADGKCVTAQLESMCQKLYDQWKSLERGELWLQIKCDSCFESFQLGDSTIRPGSSGNAVRSDGMSLSWNLFDAKILLMNAFWEEEFNDDYYDMDY